ncbi:MAG: hypothetical protein H0A76_07040 [Candidatus Thiodubiliella endoseptemdiera]|uniref:Uncharacterized protein n=1 Tax=Candidatus Thiodubiliella endoseptemdiera TaxID=2738886 RepID=A0A853F1X9_9GAMM|nr:hypothetical protein [Candidatus Thiodubiliella endoseptemdiera]
MSVLNDALEKYPHPEIFNTDQGSQYTGEVTPSDSKTGYYYLNGRQRQSHR